MKNKLYVACLIILAIVLNEYWLEGNEENRYSWIFFVRPREVVLVQKIGDSPLFPQ